MFMAQSCPGPPLWAKQKDCVEVPEAEAEAEGAVEVKQAEMHTRTAAFIAPETIRHIL